MSIVIRVITSSDELRQVYRLRYRVHLEELGFPHPLADHVSCEIRDQLDGPETVTIGAFQDDQLIGTVRVNRLSACPPESLEYHQIPTSYSSSHDQRFTAGMLVVDPRYRSTLAAAKLGQAAACAVYRRGALTMHVFGERHNAGLYERMGAVVGWASPLQHPIYGEVFSAEFTAKEIAASGFYNRFLRRENALRLQM